MIRRKSTPSGDLNALMKHARHYAEHMMHGARSIPPTLFADTEDGLLMCVPSQMEDERANDQTRYRDIVAQGSGFRLIDNGLISQG